MCIDDVRITDVAEAPIITTRRALPNGVINRPYSQALEAVGGRTNYTWSVVSNALPSGLILGSGDGVISGIPDAGGIASFSVRVIGSDGQSSVNAFSLRILDTLPIPYLETFENGGSIPSGWSQTTDSTLVPWAFSSGSPSGKPSAAYAGDDNACLFIDQGGPHTSWLISPMINLGTNTPNTRLSFWLYNKNYGGDQDELRVYYRTTESNAWELLETYSSDVPEWTQETVALPNPSSTYFIAFEGTAQYGYGVCIDDVLVTGDIVYSPYEAWKIANFKSPGDLLDDLISGDLADPDGDGIVNALEYAMGLDPWHFDTTGLPTGGVTDQHLFLTYRENMAASNVVFAVEACTNLITQDWTTNGVTQKSKANSNTWWQVMN